MALKFDLEMLRAAAQILKEMELEELELRRGFSSLRLRRLAARPEGESAAEVAAELALAVPPSPFPAQSVAPTAEEDAALIRAPMVGVIYLSSAPETPPFAKEGDTIALGQPLLIIEAMKVMNQIQSPHAGVLERILVGNGQPVEFDEPLMSVRPQ